MLPVKAKIGTLDVITEEEMSHKMIGTATIDGTKTSIREYDNGFFVIEIKEVVTYQGQTLKQLTDKLDLDRIEYRLSGA